MKSLKLVRLFIVIVLISAGIILLNQTKDREALYQVSVLSGLLNGDYDGKISLNEVRRHGDFGLGTFDRLDGEAIELDGIFYQVRADGVVRRMPGNVRSPFAMATFFDADSRFSVTQKPDYRSLQEFIDSHLATKNIPYAIKIEGKFSYIKTRSVPAQKKPYPVFGEVAKKQSVFEFRGIEGTLIGFRMPDYMQSVNVAGYHLHFLSRDKIRGGHLLECAINNSEVQIDTINRFVMVIPQSPDFDRLVFTTDNNEVISAESLKK